MSIDNSFAKAHIPDGAALAAFGSLRIVEIGTWLAAPSACAMLADLGAEVVKVEPPSGDPLRNFPGSMRGGESRSPGFALLNRNKKSVVIDIATDAGRTQLHELLSTADVLVTNMRVGALERAGIDEASLIRQFPRLIYAVLTGLGLRGEERDRPGFDTGAFWARSGMLHQMTAEGADPGAVVGGYGDLMTSLALFAGIMVALFERQHSGRGGLVEASLLQTGAWLLSGDVIAQAAFGRAPKARPRAKSGTPLVNSYRTGDGRWFFLTAVEASRHLGSVCRAIGQPELESDARFATAAGMRDNAPVLVGLLDAAFAAHPLSHWVERFHQEGVWWEKVVTPAELMRDPQIRANAMARDIGWGDTAISAVATPFRTHGREFTGVTQTPSLGADTERTLPGRP